jgi:hypothetical protein
MARVKLEISKKDLQAAIDKLEATQTFATLSDLWLAVENTEWAKNLQPRPLKAPVVLQRVRELKCTTKTQPGKKGRLKGAGPVNRTKRSDKFAKSAAITDAFDGLRKNMSEKYHGLIDNIQYRGSLKAAVKAMCLQCTNEQPKEVKLCTSGHHCPLWAFRPFQNVSVEALEEQGVEPDLVEITIPSAA